MESCNHAWFLFIFWTTIKGDMKSEPAEFQLLHLTLIRIDFHTLVLSQAVSHNFTNINWTLITLSITITSVILIWYESFYQSQLH